MIGVVSLPDTSPYFMVLIVIGAAALAIGSIGLIWLWLTAPRQVVEEAPQQTVGLLAEGDHIEAHNSNVTGHDIGVHVKALSAHLSGLRIVADRPLVIGKPKDTPNPPSE